MKNIVIVTIIFYLLHNPFCFEVLGGRQESDPDTSSAGLSPSNTENLVVLGKVWGYLKYYHPAVSSGMYNWDSELLKMLPKIINCGDVIARDAILVKWIEGLGPLESVHYEVQDTTSFKLRPDYSWIRQPVLTADLASVLIRIKNARRAASHYYIDFDSIPVPQFRNEDAYPEMSYPDPGHRLLSLFRYWNIIQYFYPYRNLIEWDEVLKDFIPEFVGARNELQYQLAVLSLIGRVHDAHASIVSNHETLETYKGKNCLPYEIRFIENKPVITGYLGEFIGKDKDTSTWDMLKVGDVIAAINDTPIDTIIRERLPYVSAANYPSCLREIAWDLLRTNDPVLSVRLYRDGILKKVKIRSFPLYQVDIFKRLHRTDTCFKMITPEIGYINPMTIKQEYIPGIMSSTEKTRGIIIDFRVPPLEDISSIVDYLLSSPADFAMLSRGNLMYPGLFTIWNKIRIGKRNERPYKGKIVILNNEDTQSAAEFNTMAFRMAPNAVIIGSTTAGSDGDVTFFPLPGGINTSISGLGVYYPDGKETQRSGIMPDIVCRPTIAGTMENRDELLEKAVQYINSTN